MPFRIMDKDGSPTGTVYQNRSEAETYWKASVANPPAEFRDGVRDGEVTVFDAKGDEIGSISLPRA